MYTVEIVVLLLVLALMLYPFIIQGIVFEAVLGIHGETDVEGCPTSDSEADQLRKFDL